MKASAQTVTRPGGGGELDLHGSTNEKLFKDFELAFRERIQKCDPKARRLQSFPDIYDYLYHNHVDRLMNTHKDFQEQKMETCQNHKGQILDCLLSKKVKIEILQLSVDPSFEKYLRRDMNLTKKEARARIIFLQHLSGAPKE